MVNEPKKNFDTSVTLSGLRLDNPVVPASGTFGYGNEYKDFYDINILGSFSFKGTTREARFGNPTPRIAECTAGMINAVGLQNPGIDAVIGEEPSPAEDILPQAGDRQHQRFFGRGICLLLRADRQGGTGRFDRGQCVRPNVRHGGMSLRNVARSGGRGNACRESRDYQAGLISPQS